MTHQQQAVNGDVVAVSTQKMEGSSLRLDIPDRNGTDDHTDNGGNGNLFNCYCFCYKSKGIFTETERCCTLLLLGLGYILFDVSLYKYTGLLPCFNYLMWNDD